MDNELQVHVRLIVPRTPRKGADMRTPLYVTVLGYFARQGFSLQLHERLLRLSVEVPAVLDATLPSTALDAFLRDFPDAHRVLITRRPAAAELRAAA